ncbi:hypothetical protein Pcinc_038400 [Petrolisthes cinctipes]|uniref:Uncharacterized protein n=1 Tax=Petrolisthes cinctipes TaxID=88211 RepID=A0AAE1EN18_PETCI|nr:hypothetical protein Pcinc_038400 [Petrolisthes cinctipes]
MDRKEETDNGSTGDKTHNTSSQTNKHCLPPPTQRMCSLSLALCPHALLTRTLSVGDDEVAVVAHYDCVSGRCLHPSFTSKSVLGWEPPKSVCPHAPAPLQLQTLFGTGFDQRGCLPSPVVSGSGEG